MADIATLGLAVDSRPVTAAVKELDKLKASAGGAEKAATSLAAASKTGSSSLDQFSNSGKTAADRAKLLTSIMDTAKTSSAGLAQQNGAVAAMAQRAGISYEAMQQRIAKAAAPLREAAKGVTTLTEAIGGGKGDSGGGVVPATERAEKVTRSFAETLTRRFVVAYAVSQLRTLGTALVNLTADAARVGDIGKLTGLGSQGTQGLTSAAGFKGIAGDAFSGALVAFNQQIPLAKEGIGSLGALLRGTRTTVTDTADAFFKVADLVKNAADDTARLSILQQAGLPATMEMARFMGQGSAAIREAAAGTSKLTDAQVEAARKIEDRWNELWTNFKSSGKAAMVDVADGWIAAWNRPFMDPSTLLGGWLQKAKGMVSGNPLAGGTQLTQSAADEFYGATGAGRPAAAPKGNPTRDVATEKAIATERISKAQQYLGLLGQTTTALEARRAVELQIQSAGLNGVGIDRSRAETLKRLAEEQNLGITAMKSSADAARVEAETIGMSVGKAQEYIAVQTALNEAKRNGKVLTEGNIESIRREAASLGEAAQHADTMRWAYSSLVQGPMQTFRSAIASGANAWDAFKAAGSSALNSIATKLMDMAANNLWSAAFPGGGGGGGILGAIGSLFGGGGGGMGNLGGTGGGLGGLFAKGGVPSASSDISRYSNQVVTKPTFFAKGGNVMGEAGPEAVMPLVRTPDGNLGVRSQGGTSQAPVQVTIHQTLTFHNADPSTEARLRQEIAQSKNQAVSEATQAVQRIHSNSPGNYMPRGR